MRNVFRYEAEKSVLEGYSVKAGWKSQEIRIERLSQTVAEVRKQLHEESARWSDQLIALMLLALGLAPLGDVLAKFCEHFTPEAHRLFLAGWIGMGLEVICNTLFLVLLGIAIRRFTLRFKEGRFRNDAMGRRSAFASRGWFRGGLGLLRRQWLAVGRRLQGGLAGIRGFLRRL